MPDSSPSSLTPTKEPAVRVWHTHRRSFQRALVPFAFLAPFLVLFAFFLITPLVYAFRMALYNERIVGGTVFVGLSNLEQAVQDSSFYTGLEHMALLGVVQIPIMIGLALLFALLLDARAVWLPSLFRFGFFLPFAVPTVVAALMWGDLYAPSFGPLAQVSRDIGLGTPGFLTSGWMLGSLGNIVTWEWTGYNMVILYAALKTIPPEIVEAAAVDGATPLQTALRIRIPFIAPALVLTGVFSIIGTLQLFNEPQIMSVIAPQVIGTAYTPNLYVYNLAFSSHEFNYAAAVSFVLGAFVFVTSYVFIFLTRKQR
jgi:multiple sugar transport system permease protein